MDLRSTASLPSSSLTHRLGGQLLIGLLALFSSVAQARAQDLVPGAFTPAPVGFNIVTILANINNGEVVFDSSAPIEDATATIGMGAIGLSRTLNLAGRYANVTVIVPYMRAHLEGLLAEEFRETSRSGLGDSSARIAVNLYGAPAMTPKQFAAYQRSTVLSVSFTVGVPTGQYYPDKVINIGTNRWAFRPEVGFSRTRGRWTIEGDLSTALFTDNTEFLSRSTRQQAMIVAGQWHVIYTVRPGLWVAGDGNYWNGGRFTVDGVEAPVKQKNSRLGLTLALPVARQQFRIAYSAGAYTTIGGAYKSLGLSYTYAWLGRP
jgi:hypothetical protein